MAAREIRQHVSALRAEIETLGRELGLQSRDVSRRQSIRALLTSEIIRVEESHSTQLRGYGAVDPSIAEVVDPWLAGIRDQLRTISAMLRPGREHGQDSPNRPEY